ncbi:MAG: phosphate signaling complex protein PhoU [Pseudomonadota bacterium]
MSRHFVREIDRLNQHIIEFADRIDEQVKSSIEAVKNSDKNLAKAVIEGDIAIDEREIELEEECLKLLALHQPMAADLRLIIAILKINNDLERIGDHAVNIAERSLQLADIDSIQFPEEISTLSKQTVLMFRKSLLALVERDSEIARDVIAADSEVDELNRQMHKLVVKRIHEQPQLAEQHILMLSVCRQLERIGDHASNIAEDVVYLLTGDIVRHEEKIAAAQQR